MNILTVIFGDRYAQKFGRALLEYFESKDFPQEILEYPELNLLYREFMLDKARRNGSPNGKEFIDYLDALIAARDKDLGSDSKNSDQ